MVNYRHNPAPYIAPVAMPERSPQHKALIDRLPEDVRAIADSMVALLTSYMTGDEKLECPVGRGMTATIRVSGGRLTARVVEEIMIQLSVYRRHLPDTEDSPISAHSVVEDIVVRFEEHRRKLMEAGIPEPKTEAP